MHIEDVMLEVTRKCNYKCEHCMRGNAQNKSMSEEVIYNFFNHVSSIGTLTLGGGEPSLAIRTLEYILQILWISKIDVQSVFLVTNGKRVSIPLLQCFSKFLSLCSDRELSGFGVSNDIYHTAQRGFIRDPKDYYNKIYDYNCNPYRLNAIEIPEDMIISHTTERTVNWYARGRAKNWGQNHADYVDNLKLDNLKNPTGIYGQMYVCYNGNVVGDANMSYHDMKSYVRGNVMEWDTLVDNLKTSTIENYHWCKSNCDNWKNCDDWDNMKNAVEQIKELEQKK